MAASRVCNSLVLGAAARGAMMVARSGGSVVDRAAGAGTRMSVVTTMTTRVVLVVRGQVLGRSVVRALRGVRIARVVARGAMMRGVARWIHHLYALARLVGVGIGPLAGVVGVVGWVVVGRHGGDVRVGEWNGPWRAG